MDCSRPIYLAIIMVLSTPLLTNAAVIDEPDFADFMANAAGVSQAIDFESLPVNTLLTNQISGIEFEETTGLDLKISDDTFTTRSGTRYVGDDFGFSNLIDQDSIVEIRFDQARSAVGLWVQYETFNFDNDAELILFDPDSGASASVFDTISIENLDADDDAYFLGLTDDMGLNSISRVQIRTAVGDPGNIAYTFDDLVSFRVAAVPEPGSFALMSMMAGTVLVRRRRR